MIDLKPLKPLGIYLLIVLTLSIFLNIFLRNYNKLQYSDQKKETLISSPTKFKQLTEDPCANSIYGDPGNVGNDYIKVNIHCSKDNSSSNTIELRSIRPDTYMGALQVIGNINSFEASVIPQRVDKLGSLVSDNNEWRCFTGIDSEIKNYNEKLKSLVTINCFYKFSDDEVKEYYESR